MVQQRRVFEVALSGERVGRSGDVIGNGSNLFGGNKNGILTELNERHRIVSKAVIHPNVVDISAVGEDDFGVLEFELVA